MLPSICAAIPVFNEEKSIIKTLNSLRNCDYPKDKLQIIVSDDGSKDNTINVVNEFISNNPELNISLISDVNSGKGAAVNKALAKCNSDLFVVIDADSRIKKCAFIKAVSYFHKPKVAAVISRVIVDFPTSWLQKMQYFEYILSNMIRKIMHNFGTLCITHGAFTMFKTSILKKVGGFDGNRNNITEDLEIALRLKSNKYDVVMAHDADCFTIAPSTFNKLRKQRIRWYRGYIFNHIKYRKLFFSKEHGIFGIFQLPVTIFAVALSVSYFLLITLNIFSDFFNFLVRSLTIPNYFLANIFNFPSISEFFLTKNLQIYIPIAITFALTLVIVFSAHKVFKEKLSRSVFPAACYFIIMPYFTAINWLDSVGREVFKSKRKW